MKHCKITETLLFMLFKYFFINESEELKNDIKNELEVKLNSMIKRELYKDYLNSNPESKQKALEEYLKKCN